MTELSTAHRAAETVAETVVRDQADRVRDRLEPPVDHFKQEVAERVETAAEQVRKLGKQLDRRDEAHAVARRLERAADYLHYRSSGDVATDAWNAVRTSKALWLAGGLVGGWIVYRIARSRAEIR